jgi:predicted phage terminase large subunit-like protein
MPYYVVSTAQEAQAAVDRGDIAFMPWQERFIFGDEENRAAITGRGSGKTLAGVYAAAVITGHKDLAPCTFIIASPTYPNLKRAILPKFFKVFEPFLERYDRQDHTAYLKNKSVVYFISLEHLDKATRGPEATGFWIDEARELHDVEGFNLLKATLRENPRHRVALVTSTPCGRSHWLYDQFGNGKPDTMLVTSRTDDNLFTSAAYKQSLRDQYGVGYFARQELDGQFVDQEGEIFHPSYFKVGVPPEGIVWDRKVRGWDLAVSVRDKADFTVGVLLARSGDDVWVLDVTRGKWEWPVSRVVIGETAGADGYEVPVSVEVNAQQRGLVDDLCAKELRDRTVVPVQRVKDKMTYALPLAVKGKRGELYLREGDWTQDFIDEFVTFDGKGKFHDDRVDATANAFKALDTVKPEVLGWF